MASEKTIEQLTNDLPTIGPKAEWMKKIVSLGEHGDTLYQAIGKDYMKRYGNQTQKPNVQNGQKPIIDIVTIPGTVGEIFDKMLAIGYDGANMTDAEHPNGQDKALEAMRGYNKRGAVTTEFRDSTEDELSPQQKKYLSMLEDRFDRWSRSKR
jgi:hypothetical protein